MTCIITWSHDAALVPRQTLLFRVCVYMYVHVNVRVYMRVYVHVFRIVGMYVRMYAYAPTHVAILGIQTCS